MTLSKYMQNFSVMLFALISLLAPTAALSDELEDRRIKISLAIFPKIIAVDYGLNDKLTKNNVVKLLFVYDSNKNKAEEFAKLLQNKVKNIGGHKISISIEKVSNLSLIFTERVAGIFLVERFSNNSLAKIIRVGISERVTVFSPYAGDVERGATVGISIGSRIKPYFNIATLNSSKVVINEKLLKVSKRYE